VRARIIPQEVVMSERRIVTSYSVVLVMTNVRLLLLAAKGISAPFWALGESIELDHVLGRAS
jgi:hypothetical protein